MNPLDGPCMKKDLRKEEGCLCRLTVSVKFCHNQKKNFVLYFDIIGNCLVRLLGRVSA